MPAGVMAKKYAKALFEACISGGEAKLEDIKNGMEIVSKRLTAEVLSLLLSPVMSKPEKTAYLKQAAGGGTPEELLNFLSLLLDKKRMRAFQEVHGEFFSLYEKHKGIRHAEARSAAPLPANQQGRLKNAQEKRYSAKFIVTYFTEPELIGGLTIKIDNNIIDDSIRNRLNEIRNTLLK